MTPYAKPAAGLPTQLEITRDRSIFTDAYCVLTRRTMSDIVTSRLPGWDARAWIIARPMTGFLETFSHIVVEMEPGRQGAGEPDPAVQGVLFVVEGTLSLEHSGGAERLGAGGYAYRPAGDAWSLANVGEGPATFHWLRKRYEPVEGVAPPQAFATRDDAVEPDPMPDTDGAWATTRFVDPADMAHDMHVNIVTFRPGSVIPFLETHAMEHGLYVLQGKAIYALNGDWVEVEAGDYMALRAFCPQACYAAGPVPFRYLLYKDVNRFPSHAGRAGL